MILWRCFACLLAISVVSAPAIGSPVHTLKCSAGPGTPAISKTPFAGVSQISGKISEEELTATTGNPLLIFGFVQKDGRQALITFEPAFPKSPRGWFHAFVVRIEHLKPGGELIEKSKGALIDMRGTTFNISLDKSRIELSASGIDDHGKPLTTTQGLEIQDLESSELTLLCYGGVFSISGLNWPVEIPALAQP